MFAGRERTLLANAMIVVGGLILLGVGVRVGWVEYRGEMLRAQLRASASQSTPQPTATFPAVIIESPTPIAAVPTETPRPTATQTATHPVATPTTTATPVPTATATATATPTSSPTPVPVGPPVRLVVPDLGLDVPVVEMSWQAVQTADGPVSTWQIPEYEAGHHSNSALLEEPGNIVISGHNNIYGRVFEAISLAWDDNQKEPVDDFTDRSDLLTGRSIQLFGADGQMYDYVITDFYRLRDRDVPYEQRVANARFIAPTEDAQLTLITCWPITNNTHRLIVRARRAG